MSNRLFSYTVDESKALYLLNTMYVVFLGVFFRSCFSQHIEADAGNAVRVDFLLNRANLWPVILMAAYFFLDWITANITVAMRGSVNHLILWALILLIVYLGSLMVFSFDQAKHTTYLYLLFALYAAVVPWWDLLVLKRGRSDGSLGPGECSHIPVQFVVIILVDLCRLAVGLLMLVLISFNLWLGLHHHPASSCSGEVIVLIGSYVLLKIVRYVAYVSLSPEK